MPYRTDAYDPFCSRCSLGHDKAIHSYSECPFEDAVLFILSDYPSTLEERSGIPFTESNKEGDINGGKFIRKLLSDLFNKDPRLPSKYTPVINHVVLANALRCNPNKGKDILPIGTKELNECHFWLNKDLAKLHPSTPILVSGSKALNSLLGMDKRIHTSRRIVHYLDSHPVVVCENFANAARYLTKEVTKTFRRRKDNLDLPVSKASKITPPLPLSPPWCLIKDVQLVKELVIDFIHKYK